MKRLAVIAAVLALVLACHVACGSAKILKRARRQGPGVGQQCTLQQTLYNPNSADLYIFIKYPDGSVTNYGVPAGTNMQVVICTMYATKFFITDNQFTQPGGLWWKESLWTAALSMSSANKYKLLAPKTGPATDSSGNGIWYTGILWPCYNDDDCNRAGGG